MNLEIKTVTITKDAYEDLISLASHSLKGVPAEEYDTEYLLRCMVLATTLEADLGNYNIGSIGRERYNLIMGVDNGATTA